jgi:EmrB/QacA subfamily drug resistance transporter
MGSQRWKLLAVLCAVYFMVILDAAIVRVAVPSIDRDLQMSPEGLQWVANAYMLTFGALLLLGGRIGDLLGRRRLFLGGLVAFTLASLLCGFAASGETLIAFRALQGLGAAAMTPAALSTLMTTFPQGAERNKAIGVWGAVGGLGATAGWIIGGPLVDGPGWEWVFWINVPLGVVLLAVAARMLPDSRDALVRRSFDLPGAVTITAGLALFMYTLVEAPNRGWGSTRTIGLFALAVTLLVAFVVIEMRTREPLMPLRILRSRTLVAANIGLGFAAASVYSMSFVLALYGQQVLGYSALEFGFAGLALPLTVALGAGIGQAVVTRVGSGLVSAVSMLGLIAGFVLLVGVSVNGSYVGDILPALLVFGPPLGAAFTAYSIATLQNVHERDAGLASGLNNTFEQIGGAFGTAVLATIATAQTSDLVRAGESLRPALNEGFQTAFAAGIAFPMLGLVVSAVLIGRRRSLARHAEADPPRGGLVAGAVGGRDQGVVATAGLQGCADAA